jgi:hypothetical protein
MMISFYSNRNRRFCKCFLRRFFNFFLRSARKTCFYPLLFDRLTEISCPLWRFTFEKERPRKAFGSIKEGHETSKVLKNNALSAPFADEQAASKRVKNECRNQKTAYRKVIFAARILPVIFFKK